VFYRATRGLVRCTSASFGRPQAAAASQATPSPGNIQAARCRAAEPRSPAYPIQLLYSAGARAAHSSRAASAQPQERQKRSKRLNLQEQVEPCSHSDQPKKPQTSGAFCRGRDRVRSSGAARRARAGRSGRRGAGAARLGVGRALGRVGGGHGDAQVALLGGHVAHHAEVAGLAPARAPAVLDQPVGRARLVLPAPGTALARRPNTACPVPGSEVAAAAGAPRPGQRRARRG